VYGARSNVLDFGKLDKSATGSYLKSWVGAVRPDTEYELDIIPYSRCFSFAPFIELIDVRF